MSFNKHISVLEQRAEKTLSILRKVSITEKLSTVCRLKLYKALVIPQLEFASSVWQNSHSADNLNRIQRKGLSICLGVYGTAALNALEVESAILPLDLRREELTIREFGKILSKDNNQPIKSLWNNWKDSENEQERHISPFGLANLQLQDMQTNCNMTIHNIEPEFSYIHGLCPSRTRPEYWNRLGSSKSRSVEQEVEARATISGLLDQCEFGEIVAFTDGSCKGNPGPCGAGACIFIPDQAEPVKLKRPVSRRGSILLGELIAILVAIEFTLEESRKTEVKGITIFSDSQSAVGILSLGWVPTSHRQTVKDIQLLINRLGQQKIKCELKWTPGHAEIQGNNIADTLAKEAEGEAENFPEDSQILTNADFKTFARASCCVKWQRRWEAAETGRTLHRYKPEVSTKLPKYMSVPFITEKQIISQLRTGYVGLQEYKYKVDLSDSPNCECGEIETVEHFLCSCENFEMQRQKMMTQLFYQTGKQEVTTDIFLSLENDSLKEHRETLLMLLDEFISSTGRFQRH